MDLSSLPALPVSLIVKHVGKDDWPFLRQVIALARNLVRQLPAISPHPSVVVGHHYLPSL